MRLYKVLSNPLIVVFMLGSFLISSCKTEKISIVGIWKPTTLILPEKVKNDSNRALFINMAFDKSKEFYYKFNSDGTFNYVSETSNINLSNANGTYFVKEKVLTVNYGNTTQESKIIKLTTNEFQAQSKDSLIVIYEKVKPK